MLYHMVDPLTPIPGLVPEVASTGVGELDHVLGGLFWGDNVVFEVTDPLAAQPFYRAVAAVEEHYDQRLYVTLSQEPTKIRGFDVLHAGPRSELAQPAPVLRAIVERCRRSERNVVLFEAMPTMIECWGAEVTARFFAHCCPQLLSRRRCTVVSCAERIGMSPLMTHGSSPFASPARGRGSGREQLVQTSRSWWICCVYIRQLRTW